MWMLQHRIEKLILTSWNVCVCRLSFLGESKCYFNSSYSSVTEARETWRKNWKIHFERREGKMLGGGEGMRSGVVSAVAAMVVDFYPSSFRAHHHSVMETFLWTLWLFCKIRFWNHQNIPMQIERNPSRDLCFCFIFAPIYPRFKCSWRFWCSTAYM